MTKNTPVYDFVGYKLLNATYSRKKDTVIEYFIVKTGEKTFDEKAKLFSLSLEVIIKYKDDDDSKFVFAGVFKINDLKWKSQLNDNLLESLFVSVMFPYVREKIHSSTDDSRGALNLPIINLRNVSLSKGVKYSPVYIEKNAN